MKNLSKLFFVALLFCTSFALTSCGGDDDSTCSDCPAYTLEEDDGMGNTITIESDAAKVCVGDDDGAGGTFTQQQVDALTALAESAGVSCN